MKKPVAGKPSAKTPAAIRIELSPIVPGGVIDGRQDRLIRGRVVSTLAIAGVALIFRGETVGRLGYAAPDGTIESRRPPVRPFLFNLSFAADGEGAPDGVTFEIEAIGTDGRTHREAYFLAFDDGPSAPGAITRGTVGDALAISATTAPVFLYLEQAEIEASGRLVVEGWAACSQGSVTVQIIAAGQPIGEVQRAGERPDVAQAFPSYAYGSTLGFIAAVGLDAPEDGFRFTVIATTANGDSFGIVATARRIAADVVALPSPEPPDALILTAGSDFTFNIDSPPLIDGIALSPALGRLMIEGWIIGPSEVTGIDVRLDGRKIGAAHHGLVRQDVAVAFPELAGALHSGFAFHCPPRALKPGAGSVELVVCTASGPSRTLGFTIEVRQPDKVPAYATIRRAMPASEAEVCHEILAELGREVVFRLVLLLAGRPDMTGLRATLGSLRNQIFSAWRLSIVTDSRAGMAEIVEAIAAAGLADRADVAHRRYPALSASAAGWVSVLAPGDVLGCDALLEVALQAGRYPDADFIYADDARISPASGEREPFFKPDWSPDLLLSTNYIGRLWFATAELLERAGLAGRDLTGGGDFDRVLRTTEQAKHIRHIQKLLAVATADPADPPDAEQRAVAEAAARRGIAGDVVPGRAPGAWRLARIVPSEGRVSILIPTCGAHGHIRTCIESLRALTRYADYEIVVIDNIPAGLKAMKKYVAGAADRVVATPGEFNWSRFNNRAAATCKGKYLLFLNDDVEIVEPDWLEAMLEHARRPEVGVVGAQLLYPNRTVQHAGMFLASSGVARHAFRFSAADDPGYFGLALTQRNVMAVTGACLLTRRDVFGQLGKFDELHAVVANDLDFCLRAHEAGLACIYTPYATLLHHEQASRDVLADVFDADRFDRRWKTRFTAGDPYFSPRLARDADDYRPDEEPVTTVFAGGALFRRNDIRRILAMKIDHIGDFVTAVPAIRRLRQLFPAARLSILAGPAARHFVPADIEIEAFFEFEFFNARSDLGKMPVGDLELLALREQLAPHRFDLAIDLRKHLDTRDVLKYTGARLLAGFDSEGRFPFLDIALEWETDRPLQHKRSHVTHDLVALVNAVGEATLVSFDSVPPDPRIAPRFLPARIRRLWQRPVVAVHPGSGSAMRMWHAGHFAALIDLLVERSEVSVIVIGGPEEVDLAAEVLRGTAHRNRAMSVAGLSSLDVLPELLRSCALFIGNNSGPKHIAASLGVPTIGVHAANVDPIEWAPAGRRAAAIYRDMNCSPCYLSRAGDCPRGVACLTQLEPALVHQMAEFFLARPVEA